MNIENYLKRIQYSGDRTPTLAVLKQLQKQHLLHVPFENLDIHYNTPITLQIDRIYNKVVHNNRGGFCFELNGLFFELLTALQFNAKRISARVYDKTGYGEEFDHFAIIVKIGTTDYLCDVGFGDFSFEPLLIEPNTLQNDVRGTFLIDNYDSHYLRVNKVENENSTPKYIFTTDSREFTDFQAMCNYHQTNPDSHFTQKRLISLPTTDGRRTITGDTLKITASGTTTETIIKNEKEFRQYLRDLFNFKD
ncbi:arylamine N-acetyltransferase family protein [Bizionia paragorgiae]|uniref:N-hydroxyarylamine O-acetyltransferase n=1 Tax=Bizionia paragorgiae TaxID=283786 RepID=A0A1H4CJI3_BIZPA|nr:arylamine N-acetyltransferase [Bizionia paragorgiae]SEA60489.1 N-hydroxyarylamine O-acetyltransferase [Bizionia paragorgiae]